MPTHVHSPTTQRFQDARWEVDNLHCHLQLDLEPPGKRYTSRQVFKGFCCCEETPWPWQLFQRTPFNWGGVVAHSFKGLVHCHYSRVHRGGQAHVVLEEELLHLDPRASGSGLSVTLSGAWAKETSNPIQWHTSSDKATPTPKPHLLKCYLWVSRDLFIRTTTTDTT